MRTARAARKTVTISTILLAGLAELFVKKLINRKTKWHCLKFEAKASIYYGAIEYRILTRAKTKTEAEAKAETRNVRNCTCG
jgi:hypothetical protein